MHKVIDDAERLASTPAPLLETGFNPNAVLPHGLQVEHVKAAMLEFINFIGFINEQMLTREIGRLESMLMPANFSSVVGEFMTATMPKYCNSIVKNQYHNGHPDILPKGMYEADAGQHVAEGIEVKASRYLKAWQGHNAEDVWLMVFVFDANRPADPNAHIKFIEDEELRRSNFAEAELIREAMFRQREAERAAKAKRPFKARDFVPKTYKERESTYLPRPFRFIKVVGGKITREDWMVSGRSGTSRRTPTASVLESGYRKMEANWIYRDEEAIKLGIDAPEPASQADIAATEDEAGSE